MLIFQLRSIHFAINSLICVKEIPVKVRQIDRYKKVQLAVVIEPPSESTSMDAGWSYWWSYGFYAEQELDSIYLYISEHHKYNHLLWGARNCTRL